MNWYTIYTFPSLTDIYTHTRKYLCSLTDLCTWLSMYIDKVKHLLLDSYSYFLKAQISDALPKIRNSLTKNEIFEQRLSLYHPFKQWWCGFYLEHSNLRGVPTQLEQYFYKWKQIPHGKFTLSFP